MLTPFEFYTFCIKNNINLNLNSEIFKIDDIIKINEMTKIDTSLNPNLTYDFIINNIENYQNYNFSFCGNLTIEEYYKIFMHKISRLELNEIKNKTYDYRSYFNDRNHFLFTGEIYNFCIKKICFLVCNDLFTNKRLNKNTKLFCLENIDYTKVGYTYPIDIFNNKHTNYAMSFEELMQNYGDGFLFDEYYTFDRIKQHISSFTEFNKLKILSNPNINFKFLMKYFKNFEYIFLSFESDGINLQDILNNENIYPSKYIKDKFYFGNKNITIEYLKEYITIKDNFDIDIHFNISDIVNNHRFIDTSKFCEYIEYKICKYVIIDDLILNQNHPFKLFI